MHEKRCHVIVSSLLKTCSWRFWLNIRPIDDQATWLMKRERMNPIQYRWKIIDSKGAPRENLKGAIETRNQHRLWLRETGQMIWKSVQKTFATLSVNIIWIRVYPTSMCTCGYPSNPSQKEQNSQCMTICIHVCLCCCYCCWNKKIRVYKMSDLYAWDSFDLKTWLRIQGFTWLYPVMDLCLLFPRIRWLILKHYYPKPWISPTVNGK